MQKEKGYVPYKIRSALVPVVNIGARMAVPLVLVGLLLDLLLNFSSVGFYAAIAGIILYGLSTLFHALLPPFRALGAGALRKSEKKLGMIRLNAKQRVGIRSRTRRGKADRGRV